MLKKYQCYRALFLVAAVMSTGSISHAADADSQVFRAGAAVVDITPQKFPVSMTGSFTDRQATRAHDRLHARCLVLDNGAIRLAIVVCDCCLIPREVFDDAKQLACQATGIPADRMLMSATHTHTAATVVNLAQCHPDPEYVRFLPRQISKAVEEAASHLQRAQIGWGIGQDQADVSNRRWRMKPGSIPANPFGRTSDQVRTNPPVGSPDLIEPAGPTDPDVGVLAVKTADGAPLALLANYSLHYIGNIPRDELSADYFGEFARQLANLLGADQRDSTFVGILSNGTSGDINNVNFRNRQPAQPPFAQVERVAKNVADTAADVYRKMQFRDWVPLAMEEQELEIAVRRPSTTDLERARAVLAASDGSAANVVRDVYAQEALALSEFPERVKFKLQAMRVGDSGIVATPCEAFCQIGLNIKQASPLGKTFVVGLANGYNGYLPTPQQHALGGYETWPSRWSYLDVDASERITELSLELLKRVARAPR